LSVEAPIVLLVVEHFASDDHTASLAVFRIGMPLRGAPVRSRGAGGWSLVRRALTAAVARQYSNGSNIGRLPWKRARCTRSAHHERPGTDRALQKATIIAEPLLASFRRKISVGNGCWRSSDGSKAAQTHWIGLNTKQ
jgi:hypothetical protein